MTNVNDKSQPRVNPLVVAMVAFYVVIITIFALPKPNDQVLKGTAEARGSDAILKFNHSNLRPLPIVSAPLDSLGLWQYWDMFSPDPAQIDFWGDAEVTFLDGTSTMFQYPRVYEAPIYQKYGLERYRKFFERANPESYNYIWPYFAQRVAILSATDPGNPPTKIVLQRHFQDLVGTHKHPDKKLPAYQMYRYYTHSVNLDTLFEAKGWLPYKEWRRG